MSIDALSWAFNLDLPSSGAKLTLLALANYCNEDGLAYPSQKAMSKKTCLCERAIRTHLVTLENLGIITRQARKRENGSYTSDLFKLHIGAQASSGNNCQRQILPTAENDISQRQILPNPAADSAYPDPSLTTTVTKSNRIADKPKATVSDLQSEKNKRSIPFPKDFEVTEEMFDWAVSLGIKPEGVKPTTLHFKDHHEANGNKFTNWNAAWRNWMRNAVKFSGAACR